MSQPAIEKKNVKMSILLYTAYLEIEMNCRLHFKYLKTRTDSTKSVSNKVFTFYFYQDMLFYDGVIFRGT